jgi:hypothetical protein
MSNDWYYELFFVENQIDKDLFAKFFSVIREHKVIIQRTNKDIYVNIYGKNTPLELHDEGEVAEQLLKENGSIRATMKHRYRKSYWIEMEFFLEFYFRNPQKENIVINNDCLRILSINVGQTEYSINNPNGVSETHANYIEDFFLKLCNKLNPVFGFSYDELTCDAFHGRRIPTFHLTDDSKVAIPSLFWLNYFSKDIYNRIQLNGNLELHSQMDTSLNGVILRYCKFPWETDSVFKTIVEDNEIWRLAITDHFNKDQVL